MRAFFIVNPASRAGRTRFLWSQVEKAIRRFNWSCRWAFTEAPRHATHLSASALEEGYELLVSVGGDGTFHEVINGFLGSASPRRQAASLGMIPSGTGTDLAKTLGIPRAWEEALESIRKGRSRRLDVGFVSCLDPEGRMTQRFFANIVDVGLGAATVQRVDSHPKRGGTLPFLLGALSTLASHRNLPVKVTIDDSIERIFQAVIVIVANGKYFGGGMKIAPLADPADGLFDVILVKDLSRLKILRNLHRIYTGSHLDLPEVEVLRGRKVTLEAEEDMLLEADGELVGRTPAEFVLHPQAVQIIC